jgi:hypothetical protein
VTAPWWAGLTPVSVPIKCNGDIHHIRWDRGELASADHPTDAQAAAGNENYPCLNILDTWIAHRDDLRVLGLTSRGVLDPVPGHTPGTGDMVILPRPHTRAHPAFRGDPGTPPEVDLLLLLDAFPTLGERLAATVAATWAQRLQDRTEQVAASRAALHAALYGRAVCAVRSWLGQPDLNVHVDMLDQPGEEKMTTTAEGISLRLPFSWLVDLWFKSMTTMWGQFCLAVSNTDDSQRFLTTIGADNGPVLHLTVSAPSD